MWTFFFKFLFTLIQYVVQSLKHIPLFATPWTAACRASLTFTIFQSLLKLTSIESGMPSNVASVLCFGFWPGGTWDLSCPSRDQTCTSWIERRSLNHRTVREVPEYVALNGKRDCAAVTRLRPLRGGDDSSGPKTTTMVLRRRRQEGLKDRRGPIGFEIGSGSHGPRYIGDC